MVELKTHSKWNSLRTSVDIFVIFSYRNLVKLSQVTYLFVSFPNHLRKIIK